MPSPQDRPSGTPAPHHRVIDAATIPLRSQQPDRPTSNSGSAAQPAPAAATPYPAPPFPNGHPPRPQRPYPAQSPSAGPPNPQFYGRPPTPVPQRQFTPAPVTPTPPRITTTQRPHRRVDTSVLCAAAALILLAVAVLVGIAL